MNKILKRIIYLATAFTICVQPLTAYAVSSADRFSDLPNTPWYYDYLNRAVDLGFFCGTASTAFSPNRALTRSQAVVVLSKVHQKLTGETINAGQQADYTDVPSDSYYRKAVSWATENKIVCGFGDGTFRPNKVVTHAELAVMFHQYLKLVDRADLYQPVEGAYKDETQLPGWVKPHVQALSGYQIFNPEYPNLELAFDPQSITLRDEATALFVRLYEKAAYPVDNTTPRWACRYSLPGDGLTGNSSLLHPLGETHKKLISSYDEWIQLLALLQEAKDYSEVEQPVPLSITDETFQDNILLAAEIDEEWQPVFFCDLGDMTVVDGIARTVFLKSNLYGSSVGGQSYVFLIPVPKDTTEVEIVEQAWTEKNYWVPEA